ncbi:MAG: hypothetical protein EOO53_02895 [Gammaproteobacteria bacterium]|nr:MAG: hypothetical protein EOO53_02895 [Gammaproteobacteria bacterium]
MNNYLAGKYSFIKCALVITASFFAQCVLAAPLSAIMTFESMTMTSEGVKKQTQFQEKFIRDANVVWTERVLTKTAPQHSHAGEEDHEHDLNFATAAKWLVKDSNNQITFRFVRNNEKKIIEPRTTEYGTLGFNGEWETAYYLVNRDALKKMTVLKQEAPKGATWYEKKNTEEFTRVLWDEANQVPLSIESGRFDGTIDNKITLAIAAAPAKLPWNAVANYQTIAYEDLLD